MSEAEQVTGHASFWHLRSAGREPLVVLTAESEGSWVGESIPSAPPTLPVGFWNVRDGDFGPVLESSGLVLFRWDLIAALQTLSVTNFSTYAATIRPPQKPGQINDYGVVKIHDSLPIAALGTRVDAALLFVVAESPGVAVVSDSLRRLLESSRIASLEFREPLFAGA